MSIMEYIFCTFLLVAFLVVFLFAEQRLWKKDCFSAVVFLLLFYMPFSLLAVYMIEPENILVIQTLKSGLFDYMRNGWLMFYLFVFFSLLGYWLVVYQGVTKMKRMRFVRFKPSSRRGTFVVIALYGLALLELFLLVSNWGEINYWNFNDLTYRANHVEFELLSNLMVFSSGFLATVITLIINSDNRKKYRKILFVIPFLLMAITLVLYTILTGDRSTIIALVLGIVVPYIYKRGTSTKTMFKYGVLLVLFYLLLQIVVQIFRMESSFDSVLELLFPQGMFANAISLFAVLKEEFISPSEGISGVVLKSIILTDHPYLYETVSPLFTSIQYQGVSGFGYYPFVDGFVIAGWLGILYNAFVIGGLTVLWRKIANTEDEDFNLAMLSYISSCALALARGMGTSYMIKNLYTGLLPIVVFYLLITGKKIVFVKSNRK